MCKFVLFLAVAACAVYLASGHGMVLNPASRGSRWRENDTAPANYDDNGLFCGGMNIQFGENGGKCGLCGDNFADPTPRTNELGGGIFGEGVIVKKYKKGGEMPVKVLVTANHMGSFAFRVCNLDTFKTESDECFEDVLLRQVTGEPNYVIDERTGNFDLMLKLPNELECKHCVFQWTWTTANSWGDCGDGQGQVGCGETQETFRTCSDISVLA